MYNQNISIQEFLFIVFVKIEHKVMFLYDLSQKENINNVLLYEESSKILEVLNLLKTQLDLKNEPAKELIDFYDYLEGLIYLGVNKNSKYFLSIYELIKNIKA